MSACVNKHTNILMSTSCKKIKIIVVRYYSMKTDSEIQFIYKGIPWNG